MGFAAALQRWWRPNVNCLDVTPFSFSPTVFSGAKGSVILGRGGRSRDTQRSAANASPERNVMDFVHVAVGSSGCLRRVVAVLTRVEVGRVPIPPVMFGVRLLVVVMVL